MVTQNLKAVVTLGGSVDSSFGKIGSTLEKSMGQATKSVKQLEREQSKLVKDIRKSKLAGADVSLLTHRYNQLGKELDQTTRKAETFSKASDLGGMFSSIASKSAVAVGGIWATSTAITSLMTVTNQNTAAMNGMAKAYDMSIEKFSAWGGVAEQADLNAENVGDMIEELTNKFGEFKSLGKQSSVSDVFGALGISSSMMDGMAAAEQFEFIMQRLQGVTDKQQAASLADMLFGGEGNKLTTYIRNTGKGINELLDDQYRYNLLTQDGADGAASYGLAFKNLSKVVTSAWQEISGISGGELAEEITIFSNKLSGFVKENKTEIVKVFKGFIHGAKDFAFALWDVGVVVNNVAQAMGGWKNVGTAVVALMGARMVVGLGQFVTTGYQMVRMIKAATTAQAALNLVMKANPIGLITTAIAGLIFVGIQLYKNWDAVWAWFGEKLDWFKTEFPTAFNAVKTVFDWSPLGMVMNNWEPVSEFFINLWNDPIATCEAALSKITSLWESAKGVMGKLKFWEDDESESSSPSPIKTKQPITNRFGEAVNSAQPARNLTVNQTVPAINVYAAPGQSATEVGNEVKSKFDSQSGLLSDWPQSW